MIDDLIGVPFKSGGRDKTGLDCYGLCIEIYERLGKRLPDYGSPDEHSIVNGLIDDNKKWFERLDRPEPYCLVLFRARPKSAAHIGVMIDNVRFIHCTEFKAVCIERINHPLWEKRVVGFYKWDN